MSFQVTSGLPAQPKRVATERFTPSTTGDSMIRSDATGRPRPTPADSRAR
jgi:hypothetical protein